MRKAIYCAFALIFITSFAFAQSHNATTDQVGNRNAADIEQIVGGGGPGVANTGLIDQDGNDNEGEIFQNTNGFPGSGEEAYIYQTGDRNFGKVQQFNDGHTSEIDQDGNDNYANVYEHGNKNSAYARQSGQSNVARQTVYGGGSGPNSLDVYQYGNRNNVNQELGQAWTQSVINSEAYAYQSGNDNTGIQKVEGNGYPHPILSDNNDVSITQDGDRNWSKQDIQMNAAGDVFDNSATVSQVGNDNWSKQTLIGTGHQSHVSQDGNDNTAETMQN